MRLATNETKWMMTDSGELLGISLGYDFCSEHEWGIGDIKRSFGLSDKGPYRGLQDRKVTVLPELIFAKKGGSTYLAFIPGTWMSEPEKMVYLDSTLNLRWMKRPLNAAWDEKSFGIRATGDDQKSLKELYDAFQDKNVLIGPGKQQGFMRAFGLTLIIDSRVPHGLREKVLENDLDHIALLDAAKATGVEELLEKAGKRWFALSPRWENDSKTSVVFWLNPMEQNRNNFGWYGVEALKQWADNKGPIPKQKAA